MNTAARWGAWLAIGSSILGLAAAAFADNGRRRQEIQWGAVPDRRITEAPFTVAVSATSGLPVVLTVIAGPAAIDGRKIRLFGSPGVVLLRASQPGNASYLPAPDADRVFAVNAPPSPPVFAVHPAGKTASVGDLVTLTAEARANPPPAYRWRRNGQVLPGATAPTLTLAGVALKDAGTYDVVAENPSGSVASAAAALAVTKRAQTIHFAVSAIAYPTGQPVSLNATATSGLTVGFELVSGMGNLSGNLLTSALSGPVTVRATQSGDPAFAPAAPVDQTFIFSPAGFQHP